MPPSVMPALGTLEDELRAERGPGEPDQVPTISSSGSTIAAAIAAVTGLRDELRALLARHVRGAREAAGRGGGRSATATSAHAAHDEVGGQVDGEGDQEQQRPGEEQHAVVVGAGRRLAELGRDVWR
jgi:hypothetical protein